MEADWEIEIGGDAPVIEAQWEGFVDLRKRPDRAHSLAEEEQLPGLAEVLIRLNAPESPVWTSKCDVWGVSEFDPDELDASQDAALRGIASYIDVLSRSEQSWLHLDKAKAACEAICARLRAVPFRCCRVDLVIRRATMEGDRDNLGITAYLTACGATAENANSVLVRAMCVFTDAIATVLSTECAVAKLQ
jgi:hypothetical protein